MATTKALLLQLLLVSVLSVVTVTTYQHFGLSVSYTALPRFPGEFYRVRIRYRFRGSVCTSPPTWKCLYGKCGSVSTSKSLLTFRGQTGPKYQKTYCEAEAIMLRTSQSNSGYELGAGGCCWTPSHDLTPSWDATSHIEFGERADTRLPNRAPIYGTLPFFRVPVNCPRTYNLTLFDPDGDNIKCRYVQKEYTPAGFNLDRDTCTLRYASATPGTETFDIMVEDFPVQSAVLVRYKDAVASYNHRFPFSKLPLQFSLQVDKSIPKCEEGVYIAKFVDPTPENGAMIYAEIGKILEITVKAEASYAEIAGLVLSGPYGVTSLKKPSKKFVISWEPMAEELDDYILICFAVESKSGRLIMQSEMRCVVVKVIPKKPSPTSHVICNETSMTVLVEKATLPPLNEDHLQLNDPSNTDCKLSSNSTHIIAVTPLNQCGTEIKEDDDYLYFMNKVTTYEGTNYMITRKNVLELEFCCKYPKHGNVSQSFLVHRKNITVWEKGMGTFTYQFEFYEDDSYKVMIDPDSYPLEVKIGSRLFMKIEATSSLNNTELFVESCRATPYDNPNYHKAYDIIKDGCALDPTVNVYDSAEQNQFKFSMEAFKFIGTYEQVYISCYVIMCEAGNPSTRCSQGCIETTNDYYVRKREAAIQSGRHSISQGPLRLKRSAENSDSSAAALSLNLAFVAGCVLAAAGMIVGVVMYRTKASQIY